MNAIHAIESVDEILQNPAHPLYAVNQAYRDYQRAVQQALTLLGYDVPAQERIAFYQSALNRYDEEVRNALHRGLRFSFVKLPPPQVGYLALDPPD